MNKLLLSIALCVLPCFALAKNDLTKQEKTIVKALKKQYKLESVEIARPYEGLVYYELITKDFRHMIADATGVVIVPRSKMEKDAYRNSIRFVKGHAKGYASFREKGRNARTVCAYYPGNETVFLTCKSIGGGSNEYEFYSTAGELLATFDGTISESTSAPVYICKDMMGSYGLLTMDGRTLLPNDYTSIEIRADGICWLTQMHDGLERVGGVCISHMTETSVPCIFNAVDYSQSEKCWKVQVHELDSMLVYDEDKQYDTSFLDEGQRLFEEGRYDEARRYYTLTGDKAKWADFYIGATYFFSAQRLYEDTEETLMTLENSSNRNDRGLANDVRSDLQQFSSVKEKAWQALAPYLEQYSQFSAKAKEMTYELAELSTRMSGWGERLEFAIRDLDRRCAELDRMEREEYNRHMEQQRINLERQRLQEQRLAREQRDRELRVRQRAETERRQREARKREEDRKKAQQAQQQQQQPQRKTVEQRQKEMKRTATAPATPRKKVEEEKTQTQ